MAEITKLDPKQLHLDRVATSKSNALNNDFVSINADYFKGDLGYEDKGDGTYLIYNGDTPMGYTDKIEEVDLSQDFSISSDDSNGDLNSENNIENLNIDYSNIASDGYEAKASVNAGDNIVIAASKAGENSKLYFYSKDGKFLGSKDLGSLDEIDSLNMEANGNIEITNTNGTKSTFDYQGTISNIKASSLPANSALDNAGDRKDFVEALAPIIRKEYETRKNSGEATVLPSVAIAQAMLESGSNLNATTLFGIKAVAGQDSVSAGTWEVGANGAYSTTANFAHYDSIEGSVKGYYDLIGSNDRYAAARNNKDAGSTINAIASGGYATDPDYASKVMSIINTYNLTAYDTEL